MTENEPTSPDRNPDPTATFAAERPRLLAVARRMLGSEPEAEDVVQEAWFRLERADVSTIDNLAGWLTTVTARLCLDALRARSSREGTAAAAQAEAVVGQGVGAAPGADADPEAEALVADAVGAALQVVIDTLGPAERVAFVLHDLFDLPFEQIAPIVDRTPEATRQLASRGRRRVRGATTTDADRVAQREVVDAFLTASRGGDFDALLALLDPAVVCRADAATVAQGADAEVVGAAAVAQTFGGRAQGAQPALIEGVVGLAWAMGGSVKVAFDLTYAAGDDGEVRITAIDLLSDPATLADLPVDLLGR